jgi:hypothetical protein
VSHDPAGVPGAADGADSRQQRTQRSGLAHWICSIHGTSGSITFEAVIVLVLLQSGFRRFSEGSRGGRVLRRHDTLAVDVAHHVHGLNSRKCPVTALMARSRCLAGV